MKKVYNKPTVIIEEFQVNEYIAGSCGDNFIVTINESGEDCRHYGEGAIFFGEQCPINVVTPDPGHPGNSICYHRPNDVVNFFSS